MKTKRLPNPAAHTQSSQAGFTVLELMIATLVFSTILLICAASIIGISRLYYKSLTASRTQEATRSIIDEISQAIQFSGGPITPITTMVFEPTLPSEAIGRKYFCIDKKSYMFVLGKKVSNAPVGPNQTNNALVFDPIPSNPCKRPDQATFGIPVGGRQLVPENMRLSNLSVTALSNNLYEVKVRLIYGDDDLICSPSVANSCTNNVIMNSAQLSNPDLACKAQRSGSQFCAVSELTATVQKRVQ